MCSQYTAQTGLESSSLTPEPILLTSLIQGQVTFKQDTRVHHSYWTWRSALCGARLRRHHYHYLSSDTWVSRSQPSGSELSENEWEDSPGNKKKPKYEHQTSMVRIEKKGYNWARNTILTAVACCTIQATSLTDDTIWWWFLSLLCCHYGQHCFRIQTFKCQTKMIDSCSGRQLFTNTCHIK